MLPHLVARLDVHHGVKQGRACLLQQLPMVPSDVTLVQVKAILADLASRSKEACICDGPQLFQKLVPATSIQTEVTEYSI